MGGSHGGQCGLASVLACISDLGRATRVLSTELQLCKLLPMLMSGRPACVPISSHVTPHPYPPHRLPPLSPATPLSRPRADPSAMPPPSSLHRSSLTDYAAQMALGRGSHFRGVGTVEMVPALLGAADGGAGAHPPALAPLREGSAAR